MADVTAFNGFSELHLPRIEQALDRASAMPAPHDKTITAEAMRYSLLIPGKRLRPLLVLMAHQACGGKGDNMAMYAANAVEMIHVFSLIHDDLPAMDDDDLRRGKPTNHKVYGDGQAILAGDALFALAFEQIGLIEPRDAAAACCWELASAIGPQGVAGGQSDDLKGLSPDAAITDLDFLHKRKTGALIRCALRMGAIIAGAKDDALTALSVYGDEVGLAFQITDDLLDVTGSEEATGKKVGKDADKGKKTYPGFLGVEGSRARAQECVERGIQALSALSGDTAPLKGLAEYVLTRER